MNRRSSILGAVLILIGLWFFLNNLRILPSNSIELFGGLFLLYLWNLKKQKIFLILGILGVVSGGITLLEYYGIMDFQLSAEIILLILGILLLYLHFSKDIFAFIFPGTILISLTGYIFLMRYFNSEKLWPSFFILLGFAFCFIYFAAYYGKNSWTLVLGVIFNILGIIFMGFSFGILSWRIYKYYDYLFPIGFIIVGIMMLIKVFQKNNH